MIYITNVTRRGFGLKNILDTLLSSKLKLANKIIYLYINNLLYLLQRYYFKSFITVQYY